MDVRMVKKAKKGNKEALLNLILSRKDDYYRLAFSYMRKEEDALDVMEDMIVKLYENIHLLKNNKSFYSWSNKILINCCHTAYRNRNKTILLGEQEIENTLKDEQNDFDRIETQIDINKLLSYLNEKQAEAIRLRYFNDLDFQTIADITGNSVGTIKSRVFYGLKKLHTLYRGDRNE
ncbi:sigma-70 family RNA polymerase sigma factor [Gracilibacillus salitolerans]|uniref:Sigma-70 family RNA polymerase sigma factor n=1 Tax=Gracilibacillus salitolerans TaxID=2663022 RepID=A0A5Q2TKU0_9BACI|nr:sigma-70 family RNA polymerase sigma factor [Gracilibacillus salitolerans]QGH34707.1 sigma-70 family RNA polymerase sigma factor [Gracilibacillus salitolerans]